MSYKLVIDHTSVNRTTGNQGRKYIVIHYTGNRTDTARGNANYFRSTNRNASAHYFVDDSTVYEVVSPNDSAWSVGVNYGRNNLFGKCTNWNSLNIEMCSTNGRITDATFNNTVALTKTLMSKYGIPASNVVRHYDVCSKRCPGWAGWLPGNESLWNKFKSALSNSTTHSTTNTTTHSTTGTLYHVQTGAFKSKANASAYASKLKSKGFITYTVQSGGLYKVQVGAYSKKANADVMVNRLKSAGFDAFVTTNGGTAAASTPKKTAAEIAQEINRGICSDPRWSTWGNGSTRVARLKAAGYDPEAVQNEVNKLYR